MNNSQLRYEAPRLTIVGSVAEVTREGQNGPTLDQSFPSGTPFNQLTFS